MSTGSFEHVQLTRVVAGDDAIVQSGAFARTYAGTSARALIVCGGSSARDSGLLAQVEASLGEAGVAVELLEGVSGNPGVAIVDAGAGLAVASGAGVVIGVGGGSVIDVAKAVATAAAMRSHYRRFLSGLRGPDDTITASLPVVAIPTLPGSGSETNGTSVITDEATGRKLSAHSPLAAPRVALADVSYMAQAPRRLLAAGIADGMCHAVEAALSTRATIASDSAAEAAAHVLLRSGRAALDGDTDALGRCWWATVHAGNALSMAGSILTHPMAHPLSARGGMHHGESVALVEPGVLRFLERRVDPAVASRVAGWFGSRAARGTAAMRAVRERLEAWFVDLDLVTAGDISGLHADSIETLVGDVLASGSRGLANTPGDPIDAATLTQLYGDLLVTRQGRAS